MYECLSSGTRLLQNLVNKTFNRTLLKFLYIFFLLNTNNLNILFIAIVVYIPAKIYFTRETETRFYSWQSC